MKVSHKSHCATNPITAIENIIFERGRQPYSFIIILIHQQGVLCRSCLYIHAQLRSVEGGNQLIRAPAYWSHGVFHYTLQMSFVRLQFRWCWVQSIFVCRIIFRWRHRCEMRSLHKIAYTIISLAGRIRNIISTRETEITRRPLGSSPSLVVRPGRK